MLFICLKVVKDILVLMKNFFKCIKKCYFFYIKKRFFFRKYERLIYNYKNEFVLKACLYF